VKFFIIIESRTAKEESMHSSYKYLEDGSGFVCYSRLIHSSEFAISYNDIKEFFSNPGRDSIEIF
jgi:hypothetical protein